MENKSDLQEQIVDISNKSLAYAGRLTGYIVKSAIYSYDYLKSLVDNQDFIPKADKKGINIKYLVKTDLTSEDNEKKEFYLNLGRDIVKLSKSDLESENLTIINTSKHKY